MGKRSDFERKENDAYFTPYEAVPPLLPFLPPKSKYAELCAGDGRLIRHLAKSGHECVYACDINPQGDGIEKRDVLFFGNDLPPCDLIITNPPWERDRKGTGPLHDMIRLFTNHADTWLLFDADWSHTIQASPFASLCKIVSVGRISWEGNGVSGMDNCAWYFFSKKPGDTRFVFRS